MWSAAPKCDSCVLGLDAKKSLSIKTPPEANYTDDGFQVRETKTKDAREARLLNQVGKGIRESLVSPTSLGGREETRKNEMKLGMWWVTDTVSAKMAVMKS